jgi:hypothetical protein
MSDEKKINNQVAFAIFGLRILFRTPVECLGAAKNASWQGECARCSELHS